MKFAKRLKLYFLIIPLALGAVFGFLLPDNAARAAEDLSQTCTMDNIENYCKSAEPSECRKLLEKCEAYYNEESQKIQNDLTKTASEKKTLQNKVTSLKKKISDLSYQINQNNLMVKDLGLQIADTTVSIKKTSAKIEDSKQKLSAVLRATYEEDQKPFIEVLVSGNDLSDFFDNLVNLEILDDKNKDLLQNIKILKTNLEGQKESLDSNKDEMENLVKIQTLQKDESARTKAEQEAYLKLTEAEYQKQLKQQEAVKQRVAEIRARIFELTGVSKAPTFGEAYEIAKYVGGLTGVRPAFLLAVLTQESDIGKNVGQCYLVNTATGEGIRVGTNQKMAKTMNPQRDVPPFLIITREVGRDPLNTLVSCPMSFGWGGAMGPAQFIPSTWAMYKDKITALTGRAPDPWDISDAFLAAAVYLSDCGASSRTSTAERNAALRYFSGSTNSKYSFYATSVLKIAAGYEDDIAALEAK